MADTKVKAASKKPAAPKATNGTAPKAAAKGKSNGVVTVAQPDPVMPGTDRATAKASGKAAPAQPVTSFPKETYLQWYEQMQLMRKFEDKAGQLYGQQKIKGFCHLYIGQEACVAGQVSALEKGDKYITAYRDHAHPLALGTSPNAVMAELFAKATGCSKGKGG